MKGLNFLFCLFFVLLYESLLYPLISIAGARPDMALIFTAFFALSYGSLEGLFFGFLSGFLIDLLTPSLLGWGTLLRLGLGFWMGNFKDNLFLENFFSKGVIAALSVLVFEIFYQLIHTGLSFAGAGYILIRYSLPDAFYSSLVGFALFYLTQKKKRKEAAAEL